MRDLARDALFPLRRVAWRGKYHGPMQESVDAPGSATPDAAPAAEPSPARAPEPAATAHAGGEATAPAPEPAVTARAGGEANEPVPPPDDGAGAAAASKRARVPSLLPPTTFVRQLPEALLAELSSEPFRTLIGKLAAAGVDLHLRENSLIGWWGGTVLVTIARHPKGALVLMLPRKSIKRAELPKHYALKGSQACYAVDDALIGALDREMKTIKEETERNDTRDGPFEFKFMTRNPGSAGVIPLDRHVQVPNSRSRLDAVGVEKEGERRLLLVDLKQGTGSELATAHEAMAPFYAAFADPSGGLQSAFCDEYRAMLVQRARLGIPGPDPDLLQTGMPVACVIGLAHFRAESTVLSRFIENSVRAKLPLYLCEFAGSDARLPNQKLWTPLGAAAKGKPPPKPFGA
jgi:hypothetical protein